MKIIIIGAGEVGYHIARHLAYENKEVVVIDKDQKALDRVMGLIDVQGVCGSGSSPVTLETAGIQEAEILLAVTDSDEVNLVACMIANSLSTATQKLARIRQADFDQYHDHFRKYAPNIDTVVNPEIEVVKMIIKLMRIPGAIDIGEFAGGKVTTVAVRLDHQSAFNQVRLTDFPAKTGNLGILIVAIIRDDELIIPRGDDYLADGDVVYFICEESKMADAMALFNRSEAPLHRVLIIGGGRLGLRLAAELEKQAIHAKIIEKNLKRCRKIAAKLSKTVVLQGNASDQNLLLEEGIRDIDVVISLTNDEETNILTSLLAKRLGARQAITRISNLSYLPLTAAIGIEQVISPRLSAINSILHYLRPGKVMSAISIRGEQAELIEAMAFNSLSIIGKPLKAISFPKDALITAILRDEQVIIPTGESMIQPDDRIIIIARKHAIPKIEKIMAIQTESL